MHKQKRKASRAPGSGRIDINGSSEGHGGDASGSVDAEASRSAGTPSAASEVSGSMSFVSSSGGSNLSSVSGKKNKKSKSVAVERSLQSEFDQSEVDGGAEVQAGLAVDGSGIGDNQAQGGGDPSDLDCSGDGDGEPQIRLLCDLEVTYQATDAVVAEVLEVKAEMQRDRLSFESSFLPGDGVKLSRNYRKAAKDLTKRFKCNLAFAKCLLELSRRVLGGMRAHLGLAIAIAHIWNGTLKRSSPPKKPLVVVDESDGGSEGDGESDVSSLPMMSDEEGNPVDLGQLNVKEDVKAQQKVLAYLTSERVSTWMRAHGCADTLQGWVSDICQLMDKKNKQGDAGQKSPVSSPGKKSPVSSPAKANGGAAAGAAVAATPTLTAKKRVKPNLVRQLGAGYRLGAPAELKPGEGSSATGQRVGVGLLAKRKKQEEHQVAKLAAALAVPQTPGLMYSAPLLNMPVLSDELWELTRTVQKVLKRRPDLANLPKGERMRKATRMAAREIHKAEVEGIRRAKVKDKDDDDDDEDDDDDDADSTRSGKSSTSGGTSGGSSDDESVGDTVSSREKRSSDGGSHGSEDEKFVVRDGSSGSDDSDDERERDRKRRVKDRAGSMNSFGTPKKSKGAEEAPAVPGRPGLMLLGDDGLKLWRIGTAKFNQGLCWVSYLHHKQAFDNHKQHSGRYSERTFKSIIHANLVPAVCAACGFDRARWNSLSDEKLILALEKVLRPSRSTDFAVELRELKLLRNGDEDLLACYEVFAEKFLYKCAEAEDAGKRIKWNVIKNAFSDAIRTETVLKHWMQEVKWSGVAHAHKRLLRKLRESRSIEQLFRKGKANPSGRARARDDAGEEEEEDSPPRGQQPQKKRGTFKKRAKGNAARKAKAAERSAVSGGRSKVGRTNHAGVQTGKGKAPPPKGDKGPKLRQWKGYDKRGASWHTDHDLYDCYDRPCHRPFCQRCRDHGHTAEYCRKPDDVAGLTREGYAEETAKGKAALRRPPPERSVKHNGTKGARRGRAPSNSGSEEESDSESYSDRRPAVNHQRGKQWQRDGSASEDDDEREVQTSRKAGKGNAARGRRNCL